MAPLVEEPLKLAAFLFAIYMVPNQKVNKGRLACRYTAGLASRLVKTSPISFQICLMVFLIRFRESLVELLVLYRLTGFTRPSLLWGQSLYGVHVKNSLIPSTVLLVFFMFVVLLRHTLLGIHLFEIQKAICHGHQAFSFHSIFSSSLHFISSSRNWMKKTNKIRLRKNLSHFMERFFDDFNHSQKNDWSSNYLHHLRLLPIVYPFLTESVH